MNETKGEVVMAKGKDKRNKKKVAKELSSSQMQASSSKNPDDFEVKDSK